MPITSLKNVEVIKLKSIGKFIELSQIKLLKVVTKITNKVTNMALVKRSRKIFVIL
jgi:hypothetical protein